MSAYAFDFKGSVFTPDGKIDLPSDQVDDYNAALERAELIEWAQKPTRFAGYVTGNAVTTWKGTKIGEIYRSNTYRNNLGARIRNVAMRGTNGASYYGSFGDDWSQLVRLRKFK